MTSAFRTRLLASSLIVGVAAIASPTYAQQSAPIGSQAAEAQTAEGQSDESRAAAGLATESEQGEEVVVTGSRIASPTITSVSPVQIVSDAAIDEAGVVNIQDVLLENPVFGSPTFSRTNTAFLTSGTGVATVDLRNLGTDRTLVLINSRRVVAGLPGSATVDLNVIPTQFIQRVDILTGGASSLYGSDAVAGVVNFIYKDDFEGIDANAQYGLTERGDYNEYQANLTLGGNFSDDRGNIMLHLGYTNQGELLSRERRNTEIDDLDTFFNITGDPADYGVAAEGRFSGLPPQGVFTAGGCQFTFAPNNTLERGFSANGGTISNSQADACGVPRGTALPARGFNRQFFRTIAVPVERYLFAARGHYDLTDNISLITEATYANTSSSREIEPYGFTSAGSTGAYPQGGVAPIESRVPVAGAPGTFTIVRNPFVSNAIFNAATDTNGDGLRDIGFSRRLLEFGTRNGSTNRDFYRFVTGFQGDLLEGRFNWDLTYNFGRTTETQRSNGQLNTVNFRNAFEAIPGPNGPICADPQARAQGCVPVNIFGNGAVSPAALAYLAAEQTFQTRITQQVVQANLSGSLFELPAGPLGIAVGGEYRKEDSSSDNDALTNAGLNGGNALGDTFGSFNVKEVYGEVNVPLIHNTPFIEQLNLRAAGRISDYSTVGTVYSYSGGLEWTPIEAIRLSGTYARSVRAPNVGELFQGPAQTFPTGLQDPCIGVTATSTGAVSTNCRADPGVLLNIANGPTGGTGITYGGNANGRFDINQSDLQGVSGFNIGNPDLDEEKSDSYTASVTINPRSIDFLRNVVLRVDYYNIKIEDAIVSRPRQFTINQCYNEGNQEYCALIRRRATASAINSAGTLEFIDSDSINSGELVSEGIDVTLTNRFPLSGLGLDGAINARVAYTHLLDGYNIPLAGADKDVFAGEIGAATDRFTANLGYSDEQFSVNFTGTYFGESAEDDQTLLAYEVEPGSVTVPAEFYLDMQASFRTTSQYEFYFGIDNLLDNDAPKILSGSPFNVTGTDTAAGVYDVFGRRFYAGARFRF